MSGHRLTFLIKESDLNEAISMADSTIDDWFRKDVLVEGDKGYVDTDSDEPHVSGADDQNAFLKELNDAIAERECTHQGLVASTEMYLEHAGLMNGFAGIGGLPLAETVEVTDRSSVEMAGWSLSRLGRLINRDAVPYAVLFNVETGEAGVTKEELKEITEHPEQWSLVHVVVG